MKRVGVSVDKLKVVILTHRYDHIGSLPDLLESGVSDIKVYAHELDKRYIEGIYLY